MILEEDGYRHSVINHSLKFVDQANPDIHMNGIIRVWLYLREFFLPSKQRRENINENIYLLFGNNLNIKTAGEKFDVIIETINFKYQSN